jgi:hypothetical protein
MTELPLLAVNDRVALQRLCRAEPSQPSRAFVCFAEAVGKALDRDYRAADLRGMCLRGQDFAGVDLTGADLRWTDLRGARNLDLGAVLLEGAQLRDTGDEEVGADPATRWLLRWSIMVAARRFAAVEAEIRLALEQRMIAWSRDEVAQAQEILAIAAGGGEARFVEGVEQAADARKTEPQARKLFGFHRRWGRQDD